MSRVESAHGEVGRGLTGRILGTEACLAGQESVKLKLEQSVVSQTEHSRPAGLLLSGSRRMTAPRRGKVRLEPRTGLKASLINLQDLGFMTKYLEE